MIKTIKTYLKDIKSLITTDQLFGYYCRLRYPNIDEYDLIKNIKINLNSKNKALDTAKKQRVFIAVKNHNWEKAGLVDSWSNIADIVHYDWGAKYDPYSSDWHNVKKAAFNSELLDLVKMEHKKNPIDIFFSYLSGRLVFWETVNEINKLGIITINFGFDDSHKFWGAKEATGWSGNAEISRYFDICLTVQSRKDTAKYLVMGAAPIFLPPGGNQDVFGKGAPADKRDIQVSFIGQKYGVRGKLIDMLRENGIHVFVRGKGWEEGEISVEEMLSVYHNSVISLGFGYTVNPRCIGLKGRDFEVPMTGVAYMTTYNHELAQYFEPGKEIIFYKDSNELINKINYYLEHSKEAVKIGLAGRKRALTDHTWEKRWKQLLEICGG